MKGPRFWRETYTGKPIRWGTRIAGQFLEVLERKSQRAAPTSARKKTFAKSHLEVRMFNVGDGEAILLVFPGRRAWLIDGGTSSSPKRNAVLGQRLAAYFKQGGLVLEALVPSHPHVDHAGAVAPLLQAGPALAAKVLYARSDDASWSKGGWIATLDAEVKNLGPRVEPVVLRNAHREIEIANGIRVHLLAGSGDGAYTSLFLQVRYHTARLFFTGDAHCQYEKQLLARFGAEDFRADLLKVTHHGSSSGTSTTTVQAVKQGLAIASTAEDAGHRLEKDTLARLGGLGNPRRVFETRVDGDIIVRTDGGVYGNGLLYQIEFETPGRFAGDLGATVVPLNDVNKTRTTKSDRQCK